MVSRLAILLLLCPACLEVLAVESPQNDFFERHVRPLLASRCFGCHGSKKQESELRLDARALILRGGASGQPAAVAGDIQSSRLLQFVRGAVEGFEMPPDEPLSESEVRILEQWVRDGLYWSQESGEAAGVLSMADRIARDKQTHWAFQPLRTIASHVASYPGTRRGRSPLDQLVLRELQRNGMQPSAPADRRTLIRRVHFDLLGLPPTVEEVEQFVDDRSSDAYEKLVDRLLASPHYGERWGRHWLDVARYADTKGYAFARDRNYPHAYTYRDYVIEAFNLDLPFDRFIVEQLAADHLALGEDNRALAALGFLTVGRKFNNVHDDIDDQIDVVTRGLLGLTVACARCHDHKYDAIPTDDYYGLYGVFSSSQEPGDLPLIGDRESLAAAQEFQRRLDEVSGNLNAWDERVFAAMRDDAHKNVSAYLVAAVSMTTDSTAMTCRPQLVAAWRKLLKQKAAPDEPTLLPWHRLSQRSEEDFHPEAIALARELQAGDYPFLNPFVREAFSERPPATRQAMGQLYGTILGNSYDVWLKAGGTDEARRKLPTEVRQLLWYFFDPNSPAALKKENIVRYLSEQEKLERAALAKAVEEVSQSKPKDYRRAMILIDRDQPQNARVFHRGDPNRPTVRVPRRLPAVATTHTPAPFGSGSGRLELARAITDIDNPLTPRVLANRIWMHHFGRPLVESPSDFGIRSTPPVHLFLLDYLASRLLETNWSIKQLQREIVLSDTYRQQSGDRPDCYAVDPENRWLWRMNRRRLEFEVLRDAMLFVSGRLDTTLGGRAQRLFESPERGRRRSIYGYIDRQDLPNLLRVFDFASPDQSVEKRGETIVPQQSLFMMNSDFVVQQAEALADSLARLQGDPSAFIRQLYLRLLARLPNEAEQSIAVEFLASTSADEAFSRVAQFAQILLLTNEFAYVD